MNAAGLSMCAPSRRGGARLREPQGARNMTTKAKTHEEKQ